MARAVTGNEAARAAAISQLNTWVVFMRNALGDQLPSAPVIQILQIRSLFCTIERPLCRCGSTQSLIFMISEESYLFQSAESFRTLCGGFLNAANGRGRPTARAP